MASRIHDYTIVIRPDDNGYIPAIEGCHAWGQTPEEARTALDNVFKMIAEEYAEAGKPLPPDVEVKVPSAG